MRDVKFILILVAVTLALYLFGLGNMALTDPDESFYAQTAKEMYNASEWVTPQIFGKPQFEKPIFYYWLIIFSYTVFGVTEFAARIPSAIFACFGVIGMYFLGRFLYSRACGLISGLVLATCFQYVVLARACVTDMVLTVFILFCLLFFLAAWIKEKKVYYLAASVMAAGAVLTKGPIGLFIPGVIVFFYVLSTAQWKKFLKIPFFWCILAFLAVSLPSYMMVTRVHGATFISEFFGFQNVTRFLTPEHRIGSSPFFYIPAVLGGFYPWTFFLPVGIWYTFRMRRIDTQPIKGKGIFLLVWFLCVFLFFSASRTKLITYIFPLFPSMALVVGNLLEKWINNKIPEKGVRNSFFVFIGTSFLSLPAIYLFIAHEYVSVLKGILIAEMIFAVMLIYTLVLLLKNRKTSVFISLVASVIALVIPLILYVLPVAGDLESSKVLSLKVKELAKEEEPIGGECDHRRGVAFYTDREDIVDIHPYHDLSAFVTQKGNAWGIIQRKHYDQMLREKGPVVSEVAKSGDYVLFSHKGEE